jgi:uncharacterized RDD family membrane protein YckC
MRHHDRVTQPQNEPAGQQTPPGGPDQAQADSFSWAPTASGPVTIPEQGTPSAQGSGAGDSPHPQFEAGPAAEAAEPGQQPPGPMTSASEAYYTIPPTGAAPPPGYGSAPGPAGYGQPAGSPPPPGYGSAPGPAGYGQPAGSPPPPGYGSAPGPAGYGQPAGSPPPPGYGPAGYGQQAGYPWTAQPQAGRRDPALASPGLRLGARVIDWLILGVLSAPLWYPVWSTLLSQLRTITNEYPTGTNLSQIPAAKNALVAAEGTFFRHMLLVMIAYCLLSLAYDWIQHGLWGQTIGKRAVGIVVVSGRNGGPIGAAAAGGRAAVYALPSVVPVLGWIFGLVNEMWLLWDAHRQCLHDHAAHSVVINKSYLAVPSRQTAGW